MATADKEFFAQKQKEWEKENAPYRDPYKGGTLAGDLGNLGSRFLDLEKKGRKEFGNYIQKSSEASKNEVQKWRDIGKGVVNYLVGSPEKNTGETSTLTQQGGATALVGPVKLDQNKLPDWAKNKIEENRANSVYDVSGAMPGGSTNTAPVGNGQLPQYNNNNVQTNANQQNISNNNLNNYQNNSSYNINGEVAGQRQLEPMTDPVAYRGDYDTSNIIGYSNNQQSGNQNKAQNINSSNNFQDSVEQGDGVMYGRASGDKDEKIQTVNDPYGVDDISLRTRQVNYQSLESMDSYDIALSEISGVSLYGETAMRDLAVNNPAKYKEIQEWKKIIKAGDTTNDIASGNTTSTTTQTAKTTEAVNSEINRWTNANSTERSHDDVQNMLTSKLDNSQVAQTATQEMLNLNRQMADLEEKIANLPKEAQKVFKGNVPQYIIDAYVSNNAQRYQSELNKLQSRYNSAVELYKTELSNKQWESEMELKNREYNFKVGQQNWENNFKLRQQARTEAYQSQSLLLNNIKTDKNGNPYIINSDGTYRYLDNATYSRAVQQQVQNGIEALNSTFYDGMYGGQCEEFTDTWNNSVYGQTMVPVDADGNPIQGRTATTAEEKVQYVNSAVPKVGETAIFQYPDTANVSNAAKKRGHTMIVIGYDPSTQMMTLKGSNRTGDEKVYTTQMSLTDFRTKYYGAGFWDPSKPTWFQKEQQGAVDTTTSLTVMTNRFESLIENAGTQGTKDLLATAQTMYETLSDLKNDGSLEELINTTDFQKMLKKWAEKSYKTDDGGTEFGQLLRTYMYNKNLSTGAKKALNRLYLLVEMKLRNESGAAISSSEWMNNFQNMIPGTFQDKQQMRDVLSNWDIVIKKYSRGGGMKTADYIPIFDEERGQRKIF